MTLAAYGAALLAVELALLAAIAVHDARTLRAPNRLVYPAIAIALIAVLPLGGAAAAAWLGGLAGFAALLGVAIVSRGAMGMGDAKAGALAGVTVGLGGVATMLAVAFVAGGALAAALLIGRRRTRRDATAFTPLLLLGVVVTLTARGAAVPVALPWMLP